MSPNATRHARVRMDQRGFRGDDVDIILESGTVVRPGLHVLRDRDAEREISKCKRRIQTFERLKGSAAVVEGDELITCYHVSGSPGRRALRNGHSHRRLPKRRLVP